MTFEQLSELIRKDPVTCMRHFDYRQRALFHILLKQEAGVFAPYKLKDWFSRIEFQMRGSPHSHGVYWLEGAPTYKEGDEDSINACIKFIDEFITCKRDEEDGMDTVIGYQIHKHSHTCKKKIRRAGFKCRFGFPKPPMAKTMILEPFGKDFPPEEKRRFVEIYNKLEKRLNEMGRNFLEDVPFKDFLDELGVNEADYISAVQSSLKRTTVVLKRSTNAIFVNQYNKKLLLAWNANIDFQFVLDTYACAKYCVGYMMKGEGGVSRLLQEATKDIRRGNTVVRDKLKTFANILINGSEISAQEAAAFLLGLQNTTCSRKDVYISTSEPNERVRMLKSTEQIQDLSEDSEDICARGLIDYYIQRPEEMEDCCLADFASLYEIRKYRGNRARVSAPGDFFSVKY